jgi:hypothetical protein
MKSVILKILLERMISQDLLQCYILILLMKTEFTLATKASSMAYSLKHVDLRWYLSEWTFKED